MHDIRQSEVALPLNGRIKRAAPDRLEKCNGVRIGLSNFVNRPIPPAPLNIPIATSIVTRNGMIRKMTLKASLPLPRTRHKP